MISNTWMLSVFLTLWAVLALSGAAPEGKVKTPAEEKKEGKVKTPAEEKKKVVAEKEVKKRHSEEGCPSGWASFEERCFFFSATNRTWADSEIKCLHQGANLASVHSREEYYFVQDLVRQESEKFPITWLGGYDATKEGLWLWSNGQRFDYANWNAGQPDNYQHQSCLVMNYGDTKQWDDVGCEMKFPSLCVLVA